MLRFKNTATRGLIIGFTCLILLMPASGFGQAPPATLSFEVATIKPAETITPAMIQSGKLHVGMNVDAARVDIGFMSLADLIPIAFKVKPYQVSGPDWMNVQRFDILAKLPEGATKEQVPEMLQALLAERFQLKVHRENRDQSVYALVVAKGGSKLKESSPEPAGGPPANAATGGISLGGGNQVRVDPGRGATVVSAEGGTTKVSPGPDGQMHMEMSKVTMEQFAEITKSRSIKLVLSVTATNPTIEGNEFTLTKVFENVIDNAVGYSDDGDTITVTLADTDVEVSISVADSGIGIPQDDQPSIFQQFFRAKNATAKKNVGTGLGLFIVKNVVNGHGGKVWFESKENEGSTFHVTLPKK